jgi:membrane dipeptidase
VGLPDLRTGGVGLICATIFCEPARGESKGYRTAEEARAQALRQLQWYQEREKEGLIELVRSAGQIRDKAGDKTQAILLMEGADELRGAEDVVEWFEAGLRIVGLAWKGTRMAGGTGEPGPLTTEGRAIAKALDARGIIHDASHLAEEAFWQLLEASSGPVMASHSNCRSMVPTDRQLSDEMIIAIGQRGGVIGINFFDKFLLRPAEYQTRRANLGDLVEHIRHMCDLIGDAKHVGIGTDMDGGFGMEHIPEEIRTSADLGNISDALRAAGFSAADIEGVMGGNWVKFFRENLSG